MLGLEYNTAIVLIGTMFLGLAAGVIGCLTLLRGRALLGDALSHATLPGICLAFLIFERREYSVLLAGAMVSGIIGVTLVTLVPRFTRIKEDAATGIVLSVFFGAGIALSSYIQHSTESGAQAGIDSFLLGNTAGMLFADLMFLASAALAVLVLVLLLYKELKLACFDRDFAAVEGWPVGLLDFAVLLMLTVTTVIGLPAVGVVLMVAMLILPAAAARFWVKGFGALLLVAGVMGLVSGAVGTLISARAGHLPAGPVIVLAGTSVFVVSLLCAPHRGIVAHALVQRRLRRRRLEQSLLRSLYESIETEPDRRPAFSVSDLRARRAWNEGTARRILARLRSQGVVERCGVDWRLTDSGVARAASVVRAHRMWEAYLRKSADIDRDLVDPDAVVIEGVLPPDVVADLEAELAREGRLPRGVTP